jgi:hypothetical protein
LQYPEGVDFDKKSAFLFLYRQVLKIDEPWLTDVAAARY